MKTQFCLEQVTLAGRTFWLDGNSKITAGNGTFERPRPNAFSLVQVDDCPGATPTCRAACYVHRLEAAMGEVHQKYRENSAAIREVLDSYALSTKFAVDLGRWIEENARGGFRWHVSGDLLSPRHVRLIADTARCSRSVRHWIYTRTFDVLSWLVNVPNLTVNVSADRDNYSWAREVADRWGLRVCYMTVDGTVPPDLGEGDVIFPHHALRGRDLPDPLETPFWRNLTPFQRGLVCPADYQGQSEKRRCGPCDRCLRPNGGGR